MGLTGICLALLVAVFSYTVNWAHFDFSLESKSPHNSGCLEKPLCDGQVSFMGRVKCQLFTYPVDVDRHDYKRDVMGRLARLLQKGLKGQPHVVEGVKGDIAVKLANPGRPLVLHFAGDNGVGKTTLAQLISLALAFRCRDMSCLVGDTSLVLSGVSYDGYSVTDFRSDVVQKIVEHAKRYPRNGVVIVNDLNGLHPDLVRVLLPLFGRATTFPEASDAPLNYLTVIITTDFGRQGRTRGKSLSDMRRIVESDFKSLYSQLSSSMIQTYPFLPASLSTAREIVRATVDGYRCDSRHGIGKLDVDDEVVEWFIDLVKDDLPAENGRCVSKAVVGVVGPAVLQHLSSRLPSLASLRVVLDSDGSVAVREN